MLVTGAPSHMMMIPACWKHPMVVMASPFPFCSMPLFLRLVFGVVRCRRGAVAAAVAAACAAAAAAGAVVVVYEWLDVRFVLFQ